MMTASLLLSLVVCFIIAWRLSAALSSPGSWFSRPDYPNERSLHDTPVPRSGGIGIWAGVLAGLVVIWVMDRIVTGGEAGSLFHAERMREDLLILAFAVFLAGLSFLDDLLSLPVAVRLGFQAAAAAAGAWLVIPEVSGIPVPVIGKIGLGWFAFPFAVLFILWITNLYNFMDGMDGFAGGMTVIGFGFLAAAALSTGPDSTATLALFIGAASAGFLVFNFPPARIFMGDVGSIPLGFLVGILSLKGFGEGLFDFWVPVIIFSPFIADATVTLLKRLFSGERVWRAHRSHYYQRLVLAGWGHRKTVLAEYALMVICGISALIFSEAGEEGRLAILLGLGLVYSAIMAWVGRVERTPGS